MAIRNRSKRNSQQSKRRRKQTRKVHGGTSIKSCLIHTGREPVIGLIQIELQECVRRKDWRGGKNVSPDEADEIIVSIRELIEDYFNSSRFKYLFVTRITGRKGLSEEEVESLFDENKNVLNEKGDKTELEELKDKMSFKFDLNGVTKDEIRLVSVDSSAR